MRIPLYRPYLEGNVKKYVNDCLDSTWISSKGNYIPLFEKAFAEYTGVHYGVAVSNGTVALHLALVVLGIGPGDEVLVPTLTYVASANAISYTGAKPVFVDSLPDTWQMDPSDLVHRITPKTKAIMAVHLYGHPCDMDPILALCQKHNLYLIEDCAEAFGTTYKGRHVGTFGDIGTFSFFGNKTITTGEGGMVVCENEDLYKRLVLFKGQGVSPNRYYWHDVIGYNYRMTNICAAIGLAQLEKADEILLRKRLIAKQYEENLKDLPIQFHRSHGDVSHSYWMCSILVNGRDLLRDHLSSRGIETRPLFVPIHQLPMYMNGESFPIAESLSAKGINLPSYPDLIQEDLNEVCNAIKSFHLCQRPSCFSAVEDTAVVLPTST